jgi:sortase A
METSDAQEGAANSGRHRAPDSDAQTAFIPRITDASPDGVPGGPLDPPASLGTAPWPAVSSGPAVQARPISPAVAVPRAASGSPTPPAPPVGAVSAADTAIIRTDTPSGAVDSVVARAAAAARAAAKTDDPPATRSNSSAAASAPPPPPPVAPAPAPVAVAPASAPVAARPAPAELPNDFDFFAAAAEEARVARLAASAQSVDTGAAAAPASRSAGR